MDNPCKECIYKIDNQCVCYKLDMYKEYQKGKLDGLAESLSTKGVQFYVDEIKKVGAGEFADRLRVNFDLLAWNNSDEVIDYTLAEWQKGAEQ